MDGKQVEDKFEESLILALTTLMNMAEKGDIPAGFDQFRSYSRISKAFDAADKSGFLELEEADYKILKGLLDKKIPAQWAFNKNIVEAIELFMNAEAEEKE